MGVGLVVVRKAAGGANPKYVSKRWLLSGIFGKAFLRTGL